MGWFYLVRFGVPITVIKKFAIFWDVTACCLVEITTCLRKLLPQKRRYISTYIYLIKDAAQLPSNSVVT